MKKTINILLLFLSFATVAQKANIEIKNIPFKFDRPTYLQDIKTISYEFQQDGKYWNYDGSGEHNDLAYLSKGIYVNGLETVNDNADLRVIAGFKGGRLKKYNGTKNVAYSFSGTLSVMIFNKKNELVDEYQESSEFIHYGTADLKSRKAINNVKIEVLTKNINSYLKRNSYKFVSGEEKFPIGNFKKTKGGLAEKFNAKSQEFINKILSNPTDKTLLDESIEFWKSQLKVNFGKKVKQKHIIRIMRSNIATAYLLKNDIENAKKQLTALKEVSGFLNTSTGLIKTILTKIKTINTLKTKKPVKYNSLTNDIVYNITIDEPGVYYWKDKKMKFSKIVIERFAANTGGGTINLDGKNKIKFFIYVDDIKTVRHFPSEDKKIVTTSGKEIIFKKVKNNFKPYIKQQDGSYILYYGQ